MALSASLLLLAGACSHDVGRLQGGGMDASRDTGAREDTGPTDASRDTGGNDSSVCNPASCFTDLPCQEAVCMGDLCVVRPRCGLGEECCADTCVPMGCNDGVDCTVDSCGASGCENVPSDDACPPGDGRRCDVTTGCQYTTCEEGINCIPAACGTATCVDNVCVPAGGCEANEECCAGSCVPLGCDDGNVCTDDSCGAAGCEHDDNTNDCEDTNPCNGTEQCSGGSCVRSSPPPDETQCGAPYQRCCGTTCVDTRNDSNNCGSCGTVCETAECTPVAFSDGVGGTCFCDEPSACPSGFTCNGMAAACECNSSGSCASGQTCTSTTNALSACKYDFTP